MRSSLRRTVVLLLVTAFLIPGLLQARTPQAPWKLVSLSGPESFFSTVWDLLANFWSRGGSGSLAKTGCGLDPAGKPLPCGEEPGGTTTDGTGDTGVGLDPAGHP